MDNFTIAGNIIDVVKQRIFQGKISVENGKIVSITEQAVPSQYYIAPGLIDAHIHIESSMLTPSEFAKIAVKFGTVATVSDPHEIANVLGISGVEYMIKNGKEVPLKFYFGAPSCVPATPFESSGAKIGPGQIDQLLRQNGIRYLSEMMNFPGVLNEDEEVMAKIASAKKYNKPVDGHAPGLKGEQAKKYAAAGITTDHECFTIEEAIDKIRSGIKVQIREGSAAKNFDALSELIGKYPDEIMFCSDDKHPNDLIRGHMNEIVRRAINLGYDPVSVLRICCLNPVLHYGLDVGLLQPGDPADFIMVDDLKQFNIIKTYINGQLVAEEGKSCITAPESATPNKFNTSPINSDHLKIEPKDSKIRVIQAEDGQLVTGSLMEEPLIEKGNVVSDPSRDILKMVVINRYEPSAPAIGFVRNFGLKNSAIASTVAHDSHNIIATGANDELIVKVVNEVIRNRGGIAYADDETLKILPLPVAGIMTNHDGKTAANLYEEVDRLAKNNGSMLTAPFMTLSFMALLVIPSLKLSDKGLFDGDHFQFVDLFGK